MRPPPLLQSRIARRRDLGAGVAPAAPARRPKRRRQRSRAGRRPGKGRADGAIARGAAFDDGRTQVQPAAPEADGPGDPAPNAPKPAAGS